MQGYELNNFPTVPSSLKVFFWSAENLLNPRWWSWFSCKRATSSRIGRRALQWASFFSHPYVRAHSCVGFYLRGGGGFSFIFLKSRVDLHMFRNRTSIQILFYKSPPYLTVIMECVAEIKNDAEMGTSHQKCPLFCKSARIANMSLYLHM